MINTGIFHNIQNFSILRQAVSEDMPAMPISIDYDAEAKLLAAVVIGEFTFEQTQRALVELMDDPQTRILWDMTDAALVGLTHAEIQDLVGSGPEGLARVLSHPCAAVIRHDLHFGIANEYDVYQTPPETTVSVFRTRDAAIRYLDAATGSSAR